MSEQEKEPQKIKRKYAEEKRLRYQKGHRSIEWKIEYVNRNVTNKGASE